MWTEKFLRAIKLKTSDAGHGKIIAKSINECATTVNMIVS